MIQRTILVHCGIGGLALIWGGGKKWIYWNSKGRAILEWKRGGDGGGVEWVWLSWNDCSGSVGGGNGGRWNGSGSSCGYGGGGGEVEKVVGCDWRMVGSSGCD